MTDFVTRNSTHLGTDRIFTSPTATALYENLLAALEGNFPTSILAAVPRLAPRVLLNEQTLSLAAAQIDIPVDTSYPIHVLELDNVWPETDASNLNLRMSVDGGSSFEAGASSYRYTLEGHGDDNVDALSVNAATTLIVIGIALKNSNEWGWSGSLTFYGLGRTGNRKRCTVKGTYFDSGDDTVHVDGGGWGVVTGLRDAAVNYLRLFHTSSNTGAGSIARLYGINP